MSYNQRNPIFSFRLSDYRRSKLDKIAKLDKTSANEVARKIIDKYLANELVEKTEDLDKEMMKLRIEKLRMEIEYQKLKIGYIKNFDKPMSATATRILKPQIITTPNPLNNQITVSPYDAKNNIIQCIECSQLFRWENKDEFLKQKYEFELHMTNNHNRALSYLEKSVLDDLRFAGASI
tara:strand:+ start:130 stop:666 length:537 start_codon:yes stop_codon:yes gene_type:complete